MLYFLYSLIRSGNTERRMNMTTAKKTKLEMLKEEFLQTTETLWHNEVQANIFVARTLLFTAGLAVIILVLNALHVFQINNSVMIRTMALALVLLLVPALVCQKLKGERKWLKIVMMTCYTIVMASLQATLGHNVILCCVFPVILSVRYYSRWVTSFVASLTVLLSGFADYFGVALGYGRLDLNMTEIPAGVSIQTTEYTLLRDLVPLELIDRHRLWLHTLQHSFIPKLFIYLLIAYICVEIARRGREAIFEQKAETEKNERLMTELNLASEIQNNVLPNIFPVYPERKEFSLYASMTAAKEVGGDFYDFFMIDDDHIGLVMADVSGKGIPAALFMMVARTLIKNRAQMGGTPSEILADVNSQLCEGNAADLFVTVWFAILEISTGKGLAVNAGHEHPALRKHGGKFELLVYPHSPAVAVMEGMKFRQHEFRLEPGDCVFVYTDGVAEATNSTNELFGGKRLTEALNTDPDAMPKDVLDNVMNSIQSFVAGAEQFDDITMLCLKYFGPEAAQQKQS